MMVMNILPSHHPFEQQILFHIEDLELSYNHKKITTKVLEGIDLSIHEGDFITVLGPSGCGKSSLLKILAGYQKQTNGSVIVQANPHPGPNIDLGVVFQQANLFPWLKIRKNIEFGLKMQRLPKTERQNKVKDLLHLVGLEHAADLLPHQLSGGMKQRAAIARALATDPKMILMDEPFGALDTITRQDLQEQLKALWMQTGKTIFFITHDIDEALFLGNRILVINGSPGKIVMDVHNPLKLGLSHPDDIRGLSVYNETRKTIANLLKQGKI